MWPALPEAEKSSAAHDSSSDAPDGAAGDAPEEAEAEEASGAFNSAEAERIGKEAKWAALERERLARPAVASSLKARFEEGTF